MGWRYGGGTRKVGGLWLAGVGEYRGVDGAGALAGRPPAGSCSCSRVGPALSLALARALALALALALGQGRSGAGRAGKWGWVGTAGKRYGERGAESAGRRASRTRGRGARGRRLSGLVRAGAGPGGGGIPAWLEWKMVGAVVALGRVALSLRGRRRASRAVGASRACRCRVDTVNIRITHKLRTCFRDCFRD